MLPPLDERWLDELDRQLRDPMVIDDPSLGTAQLAHRVQILRNLRGAGRDRLVRALMREVAGFASMCPRRLDVGALSRAKSHDEVVASRDSEATLVCDVPIRRAG